MLHSSITIVPWGQCYYPRSQDLILCTRGEGAEGRGRTVCLPWGRFWVYLNILQHKWKEGGPDAARFLGFVPCKDRALGRITSRGKNCAHTCSLWCAVALPINKAGATPVLASDHCIWAGGRGSVRSEWLNKPEWAKEQGLLAGNKRGSGANQGRFRLTQVFLGQGF